MAETVYTIKGWNEVFEKFDTRRLKLGLSYVTWPTSQDSEGFLLLARSPEGHVALAMFGALVQLAGKRKQGQRGILADDNGKPITAERYSSRFGLPIDHARAAWNLLASPQVGWLVPQAAPVCNMDAPSMQPVCDLNDRIDKKRLEESFEIDAGVGARELSPSERYAAQPHGQALWDVWCKGVLPKSNKSMGIQAASRATVRVAERLWASCGQVGGVRDHMPAAEKWLASRIDRWRESELCKHRASEVKLAGATTWFDEARYDDDDSAWEQTQVRTSGARGAARAHAGDGSYADNQAVLPEI